MCVCVYVRVYVCEQSSWLIVYMCVHRWIYACVYACAVCIDVHIVCPHIAVSYPTHIMCISHNNSDNMCAGLLPVKSLICSDHTLIKEQVTVEVSKISYT